MSQLSRTALKSLRVRPSSSTSAATATAAVTTRRARPQTRWASSDDGPGRSFKGQLLESISQRLEREKAELQWASYMRASRDRAWMWAPTIGERFQPLHSGFESQKN